MITVRILRMIKSFGSLKEKKDAACENAYWNEMHEFESWNPNRWQGMWLTKNKNFQISKGPMKSKLMFKCVFFLLTYVFIIYKPNRVVKRLLCWYY